MTLPTRHVTPETLAIYWAGGLTDEEQAAVEAHVYDCDTCAVAWQRAAARSRCLGQLVAPIVSRG